MEDSFAVSSTSTARSGWAGSCSARRAAGVALGEAHLSRRARRSKSAAPGETVGRPTMIATTQSCSSEAMMSAQRAQHELAGETTALPTATGAVRLGIRDLRAAAVIAGWSAGHWLAIWQPSSDLGADGSHCAGTTNLRMHRPSAPTQMTGTGVPMLLVSTACTSRRCRAEPNASRASPKARPAFPAGVSSEGS